DSEWRNLMLEETALAEHSRVQDLAKKELEMKRPDGDKEVVVTLK
ncbi:cell division protein FtsL, partial [Vibrio parahaemolyticus]|nr:cell division protein FtsL [Vibrio parahaemolyticus]